MGICGTTLISYTKKEGKYALLFFFFLHLMRKTFSREMLKLSEKCYNREDLLVENN